MKVQELIMRVIYLKFCVCVCSLRGTEMWQRVVKLKETGNDMETLLLKAFKWLNAT